MNPGLKLVLAATCLGSMKFLISDYVFSSFSNGPLADTFTRLAAGREIYFSSCHMYFFLTVTSIGSYFFPTALDFFYSSNR